LNSASLAAGQSLKHQTVAMLTSSTVTLLGIEQILCGYNVCCLWLQTVDSESADQMCHVIVPDGSEAWLPAAAGHTVGTMIDGVASRLQRGLEFIDVIVAGTNDVRTVVVL